ncbi:hypothetical protein D3C87_2071400 [compost metagenome]
MLGKLSDKLLLQMLHAEYRCFAAADLPFKGLPANCTVLRKDLNHRQLCQLQPRFPPL